MADELASEGEKALQNSVKVALKISSPEVRQALIDIADGKCGLNKESDIEILKGKGVTLAALMDTGLIGTWKGKLSMPPIASTAIHEQEVVSILTRTVALRPPSASTLDTLNGRGESNFLHPTCRRATEHLKGLGLRFFHLQHPGSKGFVDLIIPDQFSPLLRLWHRNKSRVSSFLDMRALPHERTHEWSHINASFRR